MKPEDIAKLITEDIFENNGIILEGEFEKETARDAHKVIKSLEIILEFLKSIPWQIHEYIIHDDFMVKDSIDKAKLIIKRLSLMRFGQFNRNDTLLIKAKLIGSACHISSEVDRLLSCANDKPSDEHNVIKKLVTSELLNTINLLESMREYYYDSKIKARIQLDKENEYNQQLNPYEKEERRRELQKIPSSSINPNIGTELADMIKRSIEMQNLEHSMYGEYDWDNPPPELVAKEKERHILDDEIKYKKMANKESINELLKKAYADVHVSHTYPDVAFRYKKELGHKLRKYINELYPNTATSDDDGNVFITVD